MPSVKYSNLLKVIDQKGSDGKDPIVKGLSYDSRVTRKDDLFFAVPGSTVNGLQFVEEAAEKGALAAIVQEPAEAPIPTVKVDSVMAALSKIAHVFYGEPSKKIPVIGITGTNGKTTITYLLEKILNLAGRSAGIMGTINYRFKNQTFPAPNTTPMPLDIHRFLFDIEQQQADALVMEVSSHALELGRVEDVNFSVGVFTNLTQDHLDFHGTMDAYFKAKSKLFRHIPSEKTVINSDDPYGQQLAVKFKNGFRFGTGPDANICALKSQCTLDGLQFDLKLPSGKIFPVKSSLIGAHNISNMLASAGAALAFGLSEDEVANGLNQDHSIPGRLERVQSKEKFVVVVDYAHTPDALSKALTALKSVKPKRILCVFGAGGDRDRLKRPLMGKIASDKSNYVIITSDNPRTEDPQKILSDVEVGFKQLSAVNYEMIEDRKKAIAKAIKMAKAGDIVLIAGKGHEDYQIIGKKKIHFSDQEEARKAMHV